MSLVLGPEGLVVALGLGGLVEKELVSQGRVGQAQVAEGPLGGGWGGLEQLEEGWEPGKGQTEAVVESGAVSEGSSHDEGED